MGTYDIPPGQSGMYGLVFDNTYSKQVSKTVTFVLMTHPTSAPPKSASNAYFTQTMSRAASASPHQSPHLHPAEASKESLTSDGKADGARVSHQEPRPKALTGTEYKTSNGDIFYTGVLSKKRRKRNQGYARRFFSLDFTSNTLSYYKNRNSSALRGSVPLALAAIGAEDKSRTISVDSGAEVWLLKANNARDFQGWKDALERATNNANRTTSTSANHTPDTLTPALRSMTVRFDPEDQREWNTVENLVGKVAGIRDAVRRLAQDTDPKYQPEPPAPQDGSDEASPTDYFGAKPERNPSFWKRKSSVGTPTAPPGSSSGKKSAGRLAPPPTRAEAPVKASKRSVHADESVHGNCMALLRDLNGVVGEFSALIHECKERRQPAKDLQLRNRMSMESTFSQEFFDAEDPEGESQLLTIRRSSQESREREPSIMHEGHETASISSRSDAATVQDREPAVALFPSKAKNVAPLPMKIVLERRSTIPQATGPPPSLIGFLRKNVGKDLSQVAMPVTANEPLSLLQRQAEYLEYSHLLDAAAASLCDHQLPNGHSASSLDDAATQRLLYVSAFAVSHLSSSRDKGRATRKPFNPLLGETYELVRPDMGWRFLAEKVSHRPVRVACAAESERGWALRHSVAPDQKFWGKSAEIIADGRVRISLFGSSAGEIERYSWSPPTCFLRNIIAGEKYIEPVGEFTITEETSGRKAVVSFKAGGVFSGRSEETAVRAFDRDGDDAGWGLVGKWTSSLNLTHGAGPGEEIWHAGRMVGTPQTHFGYTTFAASLNEITEIEKSRLPPTDSRLRPDQRAYEEGDIATAEQQKSLLEEAQRARRKDGKDVRIRWFDHLEDNEWARRDGEKGYWALRQSGKEWDSERIFEI